EKEGIIKEGYFANLTLINLRKEYEVKSSEFVSKGKNTPYEGMKLNGKVIMTIYNGEIVFEEEK
ncbi:MAG: dihydroorotase, partial [Clostridiales bacterium]|nr:dihydroorotase [Clostridiales bacterium]